jgi:LysR family transcriptional regulator, glycine cleavage system transcriptional activator
LTHRIWRLVLELDDLRCFVAAVDAPTFRAASRRVALSPAAFSDRIRRLEEALDCVLFHRTSRSRRLSEAGRRLEPHARALLADATKTASIARGEARPLPYELTIGTRYELGMSWLAPMLATLEARVPERCVHLYMGDTPDLLARVERGDIDAVVFSARLNSPRMAYANIHPERYVFVGAAGVQFSGPEDAAGHTLIDVSADVPLFRYLMDAVPNAEPWGFAGHRYMGGIGGVRYLILRGAGVGVLPEYYARPALASGELVRLLPDQALLSDNFRLVWRSTHPWHERLVALAAEMRAHPLA